MFIQKIYKSRISRVSFACIAVSLSSSLTLAPYAVAKQITNMGDKVQPVVTLSQLQPLGSSLVPSAVMVPVRPKPGRALAKNQPFRGKKKPLATDHYQLGLALKAKGNANKALVEFLKATQKNPRQINAFYEQALIFRQQGYLKLADSSLEQALRIARSSVKTGGKRTVPTKTFNDNDLTRIRLLLATVRLEQGNVGSAAEELSRSLGITLTVPGTNSDSGDKTAADASPTTILQLHPKVEEVAEKKPRRVTTARVNEEDLWSEPKETKTEDKKETDSKNSKNSKDSKDSKDSIVAAKPEPEKESAADATVSDLIKEGFAELKDHVFNPLSILGLPRIAMDADKSESGKQKDKQSRRSFWSETKRRAAERAEKAAQERKLAAEKRRAEIQRIKEEKRLAQEKRIADAKALAEGKKLAAEQKLAEEKRLKEEKQHAQEKRTADAAKVGEEKTVEQKKKRRGWIEKHLSRNAEDKDKTAEATESGDTQETASRNANKSTNKERNQDTKEDADASETIAEQQASPQEPPKRTDAITFTPDETPLSSLNTSVNANQEETVEVGSFSLTMPAAITKRISLVAALLSAFNYEEKPAKIEKGPEKPVDPIDARLKYLAEHGTSSLKEGEAFMFSEETGEATLFMGNGEVIRRTIAMARGHEEVAKLRRPDILIPEELIYNLALMAKILPKQDEPKESEISAETKEAAPTLKKPEILGKPHSFTDWLKDVLNL